MRQRDRWVCYLPLERRLMGPYWLPNSWVGKDMRDPANWSGWDIARTAKPDRRGFMLGDGIGCVSIEGCVSPRGDVDAGVLRALNTFAEVGWDKRGVQALGWLPESPPRVTEVCGYHATVASTPTHWVPLTGRRVGTHTMLGDLSELLAACGLL